MGLPRIIGITGYAQHGKDTIASVLSRELGYNRVALADQMKAAMLTLNPIAEQLYGNRLATLVELEGWDEAKKEPEVRRLLQVFGTEVGRNMLGEDVWIEALVRNTKGFYSPSERKLVIPDIRFPNEARWIRRVGELWKVTRPNFDNGVGTSHPSERHIGSLQVDQHFRNAGSKSDFQDSVLRYVKNRLATVEVST